MPLPFDLSLCNPPSPSISEDGNIKIEKDFTPAQKFILGDTAKLPPLVAREKVAIIEKDRFLKNLKKLFPKADAIFQNKIRNCLMTWILLVDLK